jgi:hypothetical protein
MYHCRMLDDVAILYSCKFNKRSFTWEKADVDHQTDQAQRVIHLGAVEEIVHRKNNWLIQLI